MPANRWSGGLGFTLASMGSAIGLGSIWKFPYEAGVNGGGSFVLPYLAGLAIIVVPLMMAEFVIGRTARGNAQRSIKTVATNSGGSSRWQLAGLLGVIAGFLILSFYSTIGGWTLSYGLDAIWGNAFQVDAPASEARFAALLSSPIRIATFQFLFMLVTALIVAGGVEGGIETACRILMPVLFAILIGLAIYALVVGDAWRALEFLFFVDPSRLNPRVWLDALGLGFFSIGVGLGLMITYAAYAPVELDLRRAALLTVAGDTAASFLAGLAIFPLVFAYGLDPSEGPGLMFVALPIAFAQMPFGDLVATTFYALLFMSALASAISLLELVVAWLVGIGLDRRVASATAAMACCFVGIPTVLSFNLWSDWHPLGSVPAFSHATVFDLIDFLTSDVLLPAGGLLIAVFAGWVIQVETWQRELKLSAAGIRGLRGLLGIVVPALIMAILLLPLFS